jgi:molybdate/tungstate transport system substrate-binding protein
MAPRGPWVSVHSLTPTELEAAAALEAPAPARPWSNTKKAVVFGSIAFGGLALTGLVVGLAQGLGGGSGCGDCRVDVLYAGSLVNLMTDSVAPAFAARTSIALNGTGAGSGALAQEIANGTLHGDVYVTANPHLDELLEGAPHGDWVRWTIGFANSPVVLGYNPNTTLGASFATQPWQEALQQPNVRIGRTDPAIDPKGSLTVDLMDAASVYYNQTDLAETTLGAPNNTAQIFPEQALVRRMQSNDLDVGFFYSVEATDAHLPYVTFPGPLTVHADYTITVLNRAEHARAAADFVAFLLSNDGEALLRKHGLNATAPVVAGDASAVPAGILPKVG